MRRLTTALIATLAMSAASAQTPVPLPVDAATQASAAVDEVAAPACRCIPAGTIVDLEIVELLNSSQRKRGDRFALRLIDPIVLDNMTLVPAGTSGVGEVVHAAAARGGGKPGELLLAARYLDHAQLQIPLRGLKLGVSGKDNAALALAVSFAAGPFAMFIRGREIEIPAGTRVHAKLAQALDLDALASTESTAVSIHQE